LEKLELWNQALRFYRTGDWAQAEQTLLNLQGLAPEYLYGLYIERIAHYRKNPPGDNWGGVTTFETK
jgi:adenylate cyclase